MVKLRKAFITGIVVTSMLAMSAIAGATSYVAGGDLAYDGGQTSSEVYSHIWDHKPDDGHNYMVKATVKVGSTKYTSGWVEDDASISADRVWYANETSYYDYYVR